jgi:hypothetical protein
MEAIAVALFLFLFGSVAIGKDIDLIHISTPQRHDTVIAHVITNHVPLAELSVHYGHEQ